MTDAAANRSRLIRDIVAAYKLCSLRSVKVRPALVSRAQRFVDTAFTARVQELLDQAEDAGMDDADIEIAMRDARIMLEMFEREQRHDD